MGLNVTKFSLGARQMAGSSDRVELQFILRGWSDESAFEDGGSYDYDTSSLSVISIDPTYAQVQNYCELRIPTQYDGMDRTKGGIRVEHLRDRKVDDNLGEYFRITVTYERASGKRREQNTETQESIASTVTKTISYNTTLEPVREFFSKGTVAVATGRRPGTGPSGELSEVFQERYYNRNGININSETREPEGADFGRPITTMTIEYSANAFIPSTYTRKLDRLVGKQNLTTFEGREPGEVLFLRYQATESIELAAYDPVVNYSTGDKVVFLGVVYICLQDAPPGQTPDVSPDFWALAVPTTATLVFEFGIKPNVLLAELEWDEDASYLAGDLVNHQLKVYRALAFTSGEEPPDYPDKWEFVNERVYVGVDSNDDPICFEWRNVELGRIENDSVLITREIKGWDFLHTFYDNEYSYEDPPIDLADEDKSGTVPQTAFVERTFTPADLNAIYTIA